MEEPRALTRLREMHARGELEPDPNEAQFAALTEHRPDCQCADCWKTKSNGYAPQQRPREFTVAGMRVQLVDPEAQDDA